MSVPGRQALDERVYACAYSEGIAFIDGDGESLEFGTRVSASETSFTARELLTVLSEHGVPKWVRYERLATRVYALIGLALGLVLGAAIGALALRVLTR